MLNKTGAYNGAKNKSVFGLALVKKETVNGVKNLNMASAKKEICFFHYYIKISINYSSSSLKLGISAT